MGKAFQRIGLQTGGRLSVRRMKPIAIFAALLFLVGCAPIPEARCLVSPLRGTVSVSGDPARAATVTRSYYSPWYDQHVTTVTHTDTNGCFEFEGAWKLSAVYLVHQPVIDEEVTVEYKSKTYVALDLVKMDYSRFGELEAIDHVGRDRLSRKGDSLFLSCDLDKIQGNKP